MRLSRGEKLDECGDIYTLASQLLETAYQPEEIEMTELAQPETKKVKTEQ
jgi:hypothetical protein